jgi:hypothetical protein
MTGLDMSHDIIILWSALFIHYKVWVVVGGAHDNMIIIYH